MNQKDLLGRVLTVRDAPDNRYHVTSSGRGRIYYTSLNTMKRYNDDLSTIMAMCLSGVLHVSDCE